MVVTVNFTPRAVRALERAGKLTGDSRTDTINRAMLVYAYLEEVMHEGGTLYVGGADRAWPARLSFTAAGPAAESDHGRKS